MVMGKKEMIEAEIVLKIVWYVVVTVNVFVVCETAEKIVKMIIGRNKDDKN